MYRTLAARVPILSSCIYFTWPLTRQRKHRLRTLLQSDVTCSSVETEPKRLRNSPSNTQEKIRGLLFLFRRNYPLLFFFFLFFSGVAAGSSRPAGGEGRDGGGGRAVPLAVQQGESHGGARGRAHVN